MSSSRVRINLSGLFFVVEARSESACLTEAMHCCIGMLV